MSLSKIDWKLFLAPGYRFPADVRFRFTDDDGKIQEFPAHKHLLACVSEVFSRQFFGPMKSDEDYVDIPNTSTTAAGLFVNYIYDNSFSLSGVGIEDLYQLLKLAHMFLMTDLAQEVRHNIDNLLVSKENVVELITISERFSEMFEEVSNSVSDRSYQFLASVNVSFSLGDILKEEGRDLLSDPLFRKLLLKANPKTNVEPSNLDAIQSSFNSSQSSSRSPASPDSPRQDSCANRPPVELWTKEQVANWLLALGMEMYITRFLDCSITGECLLGLDSTHLKQLGVMAKNDREKLKDGIKDLKKQNDESKKNLEKEKKKHGKGSLLMRPMRLVF